MLEVDDAFYLNKRDLKFSFCFFTLDFFLKMALPNEVIDAIENARGALTYTLSKPYSTRKIIWPITDRNYL